ncbi:MAG: RNA methyltransferase [Acidobacteriales bacterium]|nr:RNA methyltransferase [Terriglobales bacterium]
MPKAQERIRRITSRQNSLLQAMRRAFHKAELTIEGGCAVEGVRLIEEAIRSGLKLHAVLFSASGLRHADKLLPQLPAKTETVEIADDVFGGVVDTETPQGVAALVHLKTFSLDDLFTGAAPLVVVAAGIQDPGNLGTVVRSAEAFGASGVVMTEGTVSRFNQKVIRASAGSMFRLPTVTAKAGEVMARLREKRVVLVGAASHKGNSLEKVDMTRPTAIFIGNEGAGLPKQFLDSLDERVSIPHSQKVESLNAGIAASVFLYEAARQRRVRA